MRVWVPPAILVLGLGAAGWIAVATWDAAGGGDIPPQGWIAMGIGTVLTLALGIGLMTLVFYSSRKGYDDRAANEVQQFDEPEK